MSNLPIVLIVAAGAGYFAWSRGYLNDYLPDFIPPPEVAEVSAGDGEAQGGSGVIEQMFPASTPTNVVVHSGDTIEEQLLTEHWLWVSRWSTDNRMLTAAIMHVESRGRPGAISPAGALGLMQVMPTTAGDMYDRVGYTRLEPTRANLLTPQGSIYFGTAYLEYVQSVRNGRNLEWFIRSYNGGPGNAAKYAAGVGPAKGQRENDDYYRDVIAHLSKLTSPAAVTPAVVTPAVVTPVSVSVPVAGDVWDSFYLNAR